MVPSPKVLPPFAALRALDAVARLGGVRRAALALNLDHAVVSRHLRSIEAWTGRTLIDRSRKGGALLTEEGMRYHRRIALAIDGIAEATLDLMKSTDQHSLHIWCMPAFAVQWLIARFDAFETANPKLAIELRPTNTVPDVSKHQADVDIRFVQAYGPPLKFPPGVRTLEIARPLTILVASPSYVERMTPIDTAADVLKHHLVHRETFDTWKAWFVSQGMDGDIDLSGTGPRLNHGHLMLDAARRGRGISLANELVAKDDIAAGRLVEIKGRQPFKEVVLGAYCFIAKTDRWDDLPIRKLRNWLIEAISRDMPRA
jgi:DNA-binding transcriptional LysR family regulator